MYRHECVFVGEDGRRVKGKRWMNPDGTLGGWVAETAQIDPSVFIGPTAMVGPFARLDAGDVVRDGEVINSGNKRATRLEMTVEK